MASKHKRVPTLYWQSGSRYHRAVRGIEEQYPQGRYVIRQRVGDRRVWQPVTGDPQTALRAAIARAQAAETITSLKKMRGTHKAPETLKEACARYVADLKERKKYEASAQAERMLREFRTVCKAKTPKGITRDDVMGWHKHCEAVGNHDRTISNKHHRLLSAMKFWDVDSKHLKDTRPSFDKTLPTVYTSEQIQALYRHADQYSTLMLNMGLMLGLRSQEIRFAAWADIDYTRRVFRVTSKPHMGFKIKDKEERECPIPDSLMTQLDAWRRVPGRGHTSLILGVGVGFKRPNGNMLKRLKALGRKAGIPYSALTLHKLRRNYATALTQSGKVDLRTAMAFLGHSDTASTLRYMRPAAAETMQAVINTVKFD